jgi:hypothetical protein
LGDALKVSIPLEGKVPLGDAPKEVLLGDAPKVSIPLEGKVPSRDKRSGGKGTVPPLP